MKKLFLLVMLLAAAAAIQPGAQDWVYPAQTMHDRNGRAIFPTTDGRQFDSAMERETYLRQTRQLRQKVSRAADEVQRRRQAAASAGRPVGSTVPEARVIRRQPVELNRRGYRRALREDSLIRQQTGQARLQRSLETRRRSDAASTRADLAAARLGRTREIAQGLGQLYSGATAARQTLGETMTRPRTPLIRVPRIGE